MIEAFSQLAVFLHIFPPQTKRQKFVKQAFRENHPRYFILLLKDLPRFSITHPLKSCFQISLEVSSFIQSPSNHILGAAPYTPLHCTWP